MLDGLLQSFSGSKQGQAAMQQLAAQGLSPQQSSGIIATALPVAAQVMSGAVASAPADAKMGLFDIGDSNYVMNFMGAAVAGLIRGSGFTGAAIDGLQGVVGGHVAQVIASRCGLPKRTAGIIGAVLTPLLIDFLWDKFKGKDAEKEKAEKERLAQEQARLGQEREAQHEAAQNQNMAAMQQQMAQMQQTMNAQMQHMVNVQQMAQAQGAPGAGAQQPRSVIGAMMAGVPVQPAGYGYGYAQPRPAPLYDPAQFNPYTGVDGPVSQSFYAYRR